MAKIIPADVFEETIRELKELVESMGLGAKASGSYTNLERSDDALKLLTELEEAATETPEGIDIKTADNTA